MRLGDEWKTTFKTRDGLYEWMVMPFGFSNTPSMFMRLMNYVFKPFIGRFAVVYFDDILVFSQDVPQHVHHLKQVFMVLREHKLFANPSKCHFLSEEVLFLGYLISAKGIRIDESKVSAITTWPTPTNLHDIRSFHGLASFYRRFIQNFRTIVAPITDCLKGGKFEWTPAANGAFEELKKRVTQAPVLALHDFHVSFQEFYAIIRSLEYWRHYLLPGEFILFSGHQALRYINGQHKLNPRHAKWVELLQDFSFVIRHKAGSANTVADALSRRHALTTSVRLQVEGFGNFRALYPDDSDFRDVWVNCRLHPVHDFTIHDGYLFKELDYVYLKAPFVTPLFWRVIKAD
ncbi:hypothetical protein L1987_12850 [Smallanthus sonchifolius]|uniref:Uncharacterized protein n=1 Tax=Smallanthus sonchifolius TaxID=185202 RepID=A0ACB9JGG0_9ASTR|nr:hypothetical protein L1987_12850 [Smallanthus sonchifolius]